MNKGGIMKTYKVDIAARATYEIMAESQEEAIQIAEDHIYTDCDLELPDHLPGRFMFYESGDGVDVEYVSKVDDVEDE